MPMYCENCGFQNTDTAKFCKGCGTGVIATTSEGTLVTGIVLDNRYEIVRLIKRGGMGSVYEALDYRFDKSRCAVKEMLNLNPNPEEQKYFIEKFKEEAQNLLKLKHISLPGVRDYFTESGRYYLVMDYIDGKELAEISSFYGKEGIPERQVMEWAIDILDVLEYLHSQTPPIIYRDLKPENIMVRDSDRKIVLIDFGIARTVIPGSVTTKTSIGTPAYAPLEMIQGKPEVRSDIYSLGATMHHLLTGIIPQPLTFKPVREHNPLISEKTEAIVMKALSMNLNDRYSNAGEMKEDILSFSKTATTNPEITKTENPSNNSLIHPVPKTQVCIPSQNQTQVSIPNISSPLQESHVPTILASKPSENKPGKKNKLIISFIVIVCFLVGGVFIYSHIFNPLRYIKIARKALENKQYNEAITSVSYTHLRRRRCT